MAEVVWPVSGKVLQRPEGHHRQGGSKGPQDTVQVSRQGGPLCLWPEGHHRQGGPLCPSVLPHVPVCYLMPVCVCVCYPTLCAISCLCVSVCYPTLCVISCLCVSVCVISCLCVSVCVIPPCVLSHACVCLCVLSHPVCYLMPPVPVSRC